MRSLAKGAAEALPLQVRHVALARWPTFRRESRGSPSTPTYRVVAALRPSRICGTNSGAKSMAGPSSAGRRNRLASQAPNARSDHRACVRSGSGSAARACSSSNRVRRFSFLAAISRPAVSRSPAVSSAQLLRRCNEPSFPSATGPSASSCCRSDSESVGTEPDRRSSSSERGMPESPTFERPPGAPRGLLMAALEWASTGLG
mmetsp:Transcript_38053/g.126081  ORF Transcript_38053/g.126081 Transcript_38053/m.126081 type:complete len:203 (-) Transcript_38053:288-896(-)